MRSLETGHVSSRWASCLISALGVVLLLSCAPTQAFQLITEAEYKQDLAAPAPPELEIRLRGKPKAPIIDVLAPPLDHVLRLPVRIELRFVPVDGADIDPNSFQVLYGRLRLDITERILKHARLSKQGLIAENAMVPPGRHRFLIRIADMLQRLGEREIAVTVEAPEDD